MYDLFKLKPIISHDLWKTFEDYLAHEREIQIRILLNTNDIESTKMAQGQIHQIEKTLGLFDKCRQF